MCLSESHPVECPEGPPPLQDGERELEYCAGQQDPSQADSEADKEQQQEKEAQEAVKDGARPEAEAPPLESPEQPGTGNEEGPVNDQAKDAGQQQQSATPEVSLPGYMPLPRLHCVAWTSYFLSGAAHQAFSRLMQASGVAMLCCPVLVHKLMSRRW